MKTLIALWVLNLTVSLAISTSLTISDVVLGSYGDKSLVDSIAVFGTYNKPNLPDGKVDFRCTAIEPMSEARLPQAPEKVNTLPFFFNTGFPFHKLHVLSYMLILSSDPLQTP